MGDHRAGSAGPTATPLTPSPTTPHRPGRRVARHAAEQRPSTPYTGRRVAQVAPTPPPAPSPAPSPKPPPTYTGRRVAGRSPVAPVTTLPAPAPAEPVEVVGLVAGRRVALGDEADDDVSGHLLQAAAAPTLVPYVGRRIARDAPLITRLDTEPAVDLPVVVAVPVVEARVLEVVPEVEPRVVQPAPLVVAGPPGGPAAESLIAAPAVPSPLVELPVDELPVDELPVDETPPDETPPDENPAGQTQVGPLVGPPMTDREPTGSREPQLVVERTVPKPARPTGRRVASRRTRIPSLPLLAGVAVLAISTCGALQAVHPGLAGAGADGRLSPASALSGSSAVGSANLLGGRGAVVSRDSDRTLSAGSLQAAADAQAKQRDAALSALAGKAEKTAAEIKLHQWVLPVAPGVYHLTARFGDYSSLWSHFHTGLDFAAPTGTPIMAVAGGTISEVGYSGAYGNRTIETLPDGTELWYCHQNEFGTTVGATVKPGQVIGYVGSTGNVTGPHLHLEVHPGGGDPVDPYAALVAHGLYPGPPA